MDSPKTDFEEIAGRYDAWFAKPLGEWADGIETASIFRQLAVRPGMRLLDVGTGTGRMAKESAIRGASVVGIDTSESMLNVARERTHDLSVMLVRCDAVGLPFADGTFDVALIMTSLCFTQDPAAVLEEIDRVLRPNGRIVIGELNRWSLWSLIRRAEDRIHRTTYRGARFRSLREWQNLLASRRFVVERWGGFLHVPPVNSRRFLRAMTPFEHLGERFLPRFGAFLAIEARRSRNNTTVFTIDQQQ